MRVAVAAVVVLSAVAVAGCSMPASEDGAVSPGSGAAAPAEQAQEGQEAPKTATWGERYTWPDGLAVEVSKPVECTPSEMAMPQNITRAVKLTVTVVNDSSENFDPGIMTAVAGGAQFDGKSAEKVYDVGGGCDTGDTLGTTVLPGKTFETALAFAVGTDTGELQISLQPNIGAAEAIYVGQA